MNEIEDLLERIETPRTDVADDVARGARALRRKRRWQGAATVVSVVAIVGVGVGVGVTADGHRAGPPHQAGFATQPGSALAGLGGRSLHPRHRHAQVNHHLTGFAGEAALLRYRDVLAEHLDTGGSRLAQPSNQQSGGGMLGTKLDWNHGGMLEIVVGRSWDDAGSFYLLEDAGMKPTTYDGRPARVSTTGDDTVVSVQHPDGTVVTLIASTSFGNNGTSTSRTDLTQHELLDAAADTRLTLPAHLS